EVLLYFGARSLVRPARRELPRSRFKSRRGFAIRHIVSNSTPEQIISAAGKDGRTALSEIESKQILKAIGIEVAIPEVAKTADAAATAAARMGFPVALKVLSPSISHKSDVGGVELGLVSPESVRDAFVRIRDHLAALAAQARFDGVAVQPMAAPGGVE